MLDRLLECEPVVDWYQRGGLVPAWTVFMHRWLAAHRTSAVGGQPATALATTLWTRAHATGVPVVAANALAAAVGATLAAHNAGAPAPELTRLFDRLWALPPFATSSVTSTLVRLAC